VYRQSVTRNSPAQPATIPVMASSEEREVVTSVITLMLKLVIMLLFLFSSILVKYWSNMEGTYPGCMTP